jgi:hypothetical protein
MTGHRIRPVPIRSSDEDGGVAQGGRVDPASGTIEALVEAAVERAINRVLEPHLRRLQACSPRYIPCPKRPTFSKFPMTRSAALSERGCCRECLI